MTSTLFDVSHRAGFRYLDVQGAAARRTVVLLHGMLGDLGNWTATVGALAARGCRVLVPVLPVYDLPVQEAGVQGLVRYTRAFVEALGLADTALTLAGNSLGGQIALFYARAHPNQVEALVLSGASGLEEVEMGTSMPRRYDRAFIRQKAEMTFHDPVHVTDALVETMYAIVTDRDRVRRLIKVARATRNEGVAHFLSHLHMPTLLVWGTEDRITPPRVAHQFHARLPNARLRLLNACGHAPMIEQPTRFNALMGDFLAQQVNHTT